MGRTNIRVSTRTSNDDHKEKGVLSVKDKAGYGIVDRIEGTERETIQMMGWLEFT